MAGQEKELKKFSRQFQENYDYLFCKLGADISYDIIPYQLTIAGQQAAFFMVQGFVDDTVLAMLLRNVAALPDMPSGELFAALKEKYFPVSQIEIAEDLDFFLDGILMGQVGFLLEGEAKGLLLDLRQYAARGPQEPDLEKVVRGSRDGFTETLVYNTQLVRRRIRDENLRTKVIQIGRRSKTDVCVCYIEDVANSHLLALVLEKLNAIDIDGLPMAEKSIEELITPGMIWNPFPKVRYTERPDVAAEHLLTGHILIMVDTSPSVIILPATYFYHLQHAEEFRQNPFVGGYLRIVRMFAIFLSVFILPWWYLQVVEQGVIIPGSVALFWQLIIAEIVVDIIRLAAIHTPSPLTTSLGLVAALLVGNLSIDLGLFSTHVVMYTAAAATASFATPSYELSMAHRLVRILLLGAVFLGGKLGFWLAVGGVFFFLASSKSFGIPYLWPLVPFHWRALKEIFFRTPVSKQIYRPSVLQPKNKVRQKPVDLKGEESWRK